MKPLNRRSQTSIKPAWKFLRLTRFQIFLLGSVVLIMALITFLLNQQGIFYNNKNRFFWTYDRDYSFVPLYSSMDSLRSSHYPHTSHPIITKLDRIYKPPPSGPYVIEKYKLLFFAFPKVASSEWIRMFARMSGNPHWCTKNIHKQENHKIKFLFNFTVEEATKMMISPEWTRALFVREPKQRVLSAFFDKVMTAKDEFIHNHCSKNHSQTRRFGNYSSDANSSNTTHSMYNIQDFNYILRLHVAATKRGFANVHYEPLYHKIDEKWWPYINFIGYTDDIQSEARRLLENLYRNDTSEMNAWEQWGKTGWKGRRKRIDCSLNGGYKNSFLQRNDQHHATDLSVKMLQYYTPSIEKFVEKWWKDDLENDYYSFPPLWLFPYDREQVSIKNGRISYIDSKYR